MTYPWQPNSSVYAYQPDCTDQNWPDIASDDAQNLYAVWYDLRDGGSAVYFAYRPHGGAWSANVRVSDLIGSVAGPPKIAVTAGGAAHVVWQDNRNGNPDIYHSYRLTDGSWAPNRRVNSDSGAAPQRDPAIGVDDAGTVWVVWTDDRNGDEDVYVTSGSAAGGWGQEMRLNDDAGTAPQRTPDVAVDGAGNVDVVWADGRNNQRAPDIYSARRPFGGVWGANVLLAAAYDPHYELGLYDPIIATNRAGYAYMGYSYYIPWSGGSHSIQGIRRPPGGAWGDGWHVMWDNELWDIAVDSNGIGYVALTEYHSAPAYFPTYFVVVGCAPGGQHECGIGVFATSNHRFQPGYAAITSSSAGTVDVVWDHYNDRSGGILYRDNTTDGVLVNDDICSSPGTTGLSLATDPAGVAFALWEDQQLGDAGVYFG